MSEASDRPSWGRLRVVEVAGRGASGRVLKVLDAETGEARALRVVPETGRPLVLDELDQLARLRHPSLPRVFEVGRSAEPIDELPAGSPFWLAEWIAGERCDARSWDGPDRAARIWTLLGDIAGALATLHAAGLIHGDVAPQNVRIAEEGRAVLVDPGLGVAPGPRSTAPYLAPEAAAGEPEPRSDLYGLGATVVRLVTGRPLDEAGSPAELLPRIVAGGPPPERSELPAPLADLVRRLVAPDAGDRPRSALAVLDELDALAAAIAIAPGSPRRPRPRVSAVPAQATWPGAAAAIDAIARSLAAGGVIVVAGPAASGARELADGAVRRHHLADVARGTPVAPRIVGTLDEIGAALVPPAAPDARAADPASAARAWIERLARAARRRGAPVVIEAIGDPRAGDLLGALARADGPGPVIAIVDAAPARPRLEAVAVHIAPILDDDSTAALAATMLGTTPPRTWSRALRVASGGLPLLVIDLIRSIAGEPQPFAVDWSVRTTAGLTELRARQLRAAQAGARRVAAAVAAWGGRVRIDRALAALRADGKPPAVLADVAELERVGLAHRRGDTVAIDRATADAVDAVVGPEAVARLSAAALDLRDRSARGSLPGSPGHGADPEGRGELVLLAPLLERSALDAGRAALACEVAEQLLACGRADRALGLAGRAIAIVPARARLIAARAAIALGAHHDAAAHARAAEAAGADPVAAQLIAACAAERAGELDAAAAALSALHAAHPGDPEVAGSYARLLVDRARYREARAVAVAAGPLVGLAAEAAGLAAFHLGELDAADAAFAALEVGAAVSGDAAGAGRASSLRGMVARQRGQLGLASDRHREAVRRLTDVGEVHAAAAAELDLGTVLTERGRASEALPRLAAAGRVFAELGARTELCATELHRGSALLQVGQLDDARVAADAAVAHADRAPHLRALGLIVAGDARRRLGDEPGAVARYREALALAIEHGDARAQLGAYVALAEAGQRDGIGDGSPAGAASTTAPRAAPGAAAGVAIEALCANDDERDRWVLARGRLALRDPPSLVVRPGGSLADATAALARACAEVAARAGDADRLERAFRGHAIAAQLAHRARDAALARAEAERARVAHATWSAAAAPAFRAAIDGDPDLARLPGGDPPVPRAAPAARSAEAQITELRRLLALSRRLNAEAGAEASTGRLLDEVIDAAIEMTGAERGFVLLRPSGGELAAVVSRNFAAGELEPAAGDAAQPASRAIAERVAHTGEPVITVDAAIHDPPGTALRLRSVLAVPLRHRGTTIGCLYVDHRLRDGAFDAAAAGALGELADLAAIAIENARLTAELRRTGRAVDELNARLGDELAERDAELVRITAGLPERDRLRHRHDRIAGRSPAMVKMLGVVDRAAATALPVVIVGETGTGKELVARALHDRGPRRAGPFVAVSCSAVPEPLLESELFGHVRGALPGADRDRLGLFEVAHGGTLFLDEIAGTSPAMQTRLLRVLQDGMVRRIGDTRARLVDVRVVAATQQPLAALAAAGRFREDLRLRLDVITVPVPPLRDRDGDLPLLVDHLLARLARGKPPRLTRAALRALGQHRWPGNVRELENALARCVATGGELIDVDDLPEAIGRPLARPEPAQPAVDDLRLRPAIAATEQAYLAAAMARARGNQTAAARLLGLSRFGLQKKLRRLAGDPGEPEDDGGDGDG
ncbi:MAG TPA: sigma 54-interacting transcriptional regulator [Kofleriaceae bacterium]|nr:sigma 54-interacting transcriptional regulator [Kofleriaceae bacterium]